MDEIIQEIISPSGQYKATILKRPNYYSIDIYVLRGNLESKTDEYWSKKNISPLLVDKKFNAVHSAIQQLRVLIGEPELPISIEWVRDFSLCKDAKFLSPDDVRVFNEWINPDNKQKETTSIKAKTIIDFAGLCLVEEIGYEDEWQMGQMDEKGTICCWCIYGTLREAIIGL